MCHCIGYLHLVMITVADLRGALGKRAPRGGPNSFNFMQLLGKFGKIVRWRPDGELAPLPRGNPGSGTVNHDVIEAACSLTYRHINILYPP